VVAPTCRLVQGKVRVLDLFSGIGGFSLGLERAGMRTVAFCEIDPYCRAVLRKHWPGVPIHEDVRILKGEAVGAIDLICGGFPCQPFSHAGKRMGREDDRHLWPEYRRLIEELRPAWVIGENVAGIINLELDNVLADLGSIGYSAATFNIPACAVGAPHRRERVWIVAHADGGGRGGSEHGQQQGQWAEVADTGRSGDVADADLEYREKCDFGAKAWQSPPCGDDIARCGLQGWWEIEPDVGRVADGIPARMDRLKGLGNAVVPQIPEIIGRAIMRATTSVVETVREGRL
jgi:DNA (cytosine-5)-methyltransferase 1